jgi:hypothetical protein
MEMRIVRRPVLSLRLLGTTLNLCPRPAQRKKQQRENCIEHDLVGNGPAAGDDTRYRIWQQAMQKYRRHCDMARSLDQGKPWKRPRLRLHVPNSGLERHGDQRPSGSEGELPAKYTLTTATRCH